MTMSIRYKGSRCHNLVISARVETLGIRREKKKIFKYHFTGRVTWKSAFIGVWYVVGRLGLDEQPVNFV